MRDTVPAAGARAAVPVLGGIACAVPIILATVPLSAGLAGSQKLFDVVFVLVVVFTLLQAPLLAPLAKALGLTRPDRPVELTVESAPLEAVHAELLSVAIAPRSRLNLIKVSELRLPELGARISLVVRQGRTYVPDDPFRLRTGDQLLIVVAPDARDATENRLVTVARAGRAAPWLPATTTRADRRRAPRRQPRPPLSWMLAAPICGFGERSTDWRTPQRVGRRDR